MDLRVGSNCASIFSPTSYSVPLHTQWHSNWKVTSLLHMNINDNIQVHIVGRGGGRGNIGVQVPRVEKKKLLHSFTGCYTQRLSKFKPCSYWLKITAYTNDILRSLTSQHPLHQMFLFHTISDYYGRSILNCQINCS